MQSPVPHPSLPWIQVAPDAPYFITEDGQPWTPIGQNDAITWPELEGLFRRKNLPAVEEYLAYLSAHGVTCLRLMLEYAQGENRYFEKPVGKFAPNMVRLWDDLFALCAKYGLRILLTPFDTFWMWLRWKHHPYNKNLGGPCAGRGQWLLCPNTLEAIKARLTFVVERWGGSGVLFAWDLWNEMHPAHMGNSSAQFAPVATQLSQHVRDLEMRLYGRSHPQTVSIFGPILHTHPDVADTIFRHPLLDFSSTHFYDSKTIDYPKNTVDSAIKVGELVREALEHTPQNRPFFDSEHGPIHLFKDRKHTLAPEFDDEYFRHIQWAHMASGAAGGGMRWPNRHPHTLTPGMRVAQKHMARFLELIQWSTFRRRNLNQEIKVSEPSFAVFGCADDRQAVVWLLRTNALYQRKRLMNPAAPALTVEVQVPGLPDGRYRVTTFHTLAGTTLEQLEAQAQGTVCTFTLANVRTDVAVAIVKVS
ncbi:hypothetical protein ACD591_01340 [Rufibacter glacialis]|uniref:Cellulase family glycosylhydrolase n=1 Tax=Rufibacter glacialis TaxID=1259555 RepID=A0ABV4RBG1_9BACT|nr:hypothetical protein [Rufibacter glacialis]GGK64431.1 hypothetical protein GCM10011405_10470 [Rufibacter glacialis]